MSNTSESPAFRDQAGPQNNLSTVADQAGKMYTDDSQKATQWLRAVAPGGFINIVTATANFERIETRTFIDDEAMRAYIKDEHAKRRGVFWQPNECYDREYPHARPGKKDVTRIRVLHLDLDFKDFFGENREVPQHQKDELHLRVKAGKGLGPNGEDVPPTYIVFSGGGFHAYWVLGESLEPTQENIARVEAINANIAKTFRAGSGTKDISRLLRVAFTTNFVNDKKRKAGRIDAAVTGAGGEHKARYTLDHFGVLIEKIKAAPTMTIDVAKAQRLESVDALDEWKVSDRVKAIVVQGQYPGETKAGDNSRSAWLFDAVCNMLRAGVPDDVVYSVITDPKFGIAESVIEKKGQMRRYALKQIDSAHEHIEEPWLAELNSKYFVVPVGKDTLVGNFEPTIVGFDKNDKPIFRDAIVYRSLAAFQALYENRRIEVGTNAAGNPIYVEVGKWWRKHEKRRQVEGVAFRPDSLEELVDGKLNTFRGFACEPTIGERHLPFKQFVFEVICNRDPIVFDYLWKWIAYAVQYPARVGEVAIGLRGLKGTGKTFFAAVIAYLFGQHGLVTGDGELFVGKFNAPLELLTLLVMDEAHVFTDQRSKGVVKTRITGATTDIERKGIDRVTVPNCLHVIIISNDDRFLDVTDDERRYLALSVSDERKDDFDYFKDLQSGLSGGGYSDLLGELMAVDLKDYEVRRAPKTGELQRQAGLAKAGTPIADQVAEVLDMIPFGCFKLTELCEFLGLEIKGSNDAHFRDVKNALVAAGYEHDKRTPIGDHKQIRVWFKTGMPLARVRLFKRPATGTYGNFDETCFEWHRADYPAIDAALMEQFGPYFGPWFVSAYLGKAQGVTPTEEERSRLHAKALESLGEVVKGGRGAKI